ncbi:MAG: sigma-54-dependent Fis family transcriptional regulator [Acidobacteria bacterium]|nr:sigma-54-dependent Fis family transcriptional regulator [Acidobacteriota bacterium]
MGLGRGFPAEVFVPDDPFPEIDGACPEIRGLKQDLSRVARDPDVTVLILGESGTGKDRIARAIHRASPRCRAPFVIVDCAGLTATLAGDELFGHVRGAFTGAFDDRAGPFERANGGTVLLDEVGDLAIDLQMKLLRAIQSRTVQRLGGRQETGFDARIIASTNVNLALATTSGRFREDLYYRLKVYEIRVPPLRSRGPGDIRVLAAAILARLAERRHRPAPRLDSEVLDVLARHRWPGNIRELENTLERMLVAAAPADVVLTVRHLPDDFGATPNPAAGPGRHALPPVQDALAALAQNGATLGRTAKALGVSRHQLYRLLKRSGVGYRTRS